MHYITKIKDFKIRFATRKDVPIILDFIKKLAKYEQMEDQVVATIPLLEEYIFKQKKAQVIIGEYCNQPITFALFFNNFSTFLGKPGIYLEDLFVDIEYRGKGFGKTMITFLAKYAKESNYGRLEWSCLDWNQSAIDFYQSLGAVLMSEWTTFRLAKQSLIDLAKEFD